MGEQSGRVVTTRPLSRSRSSHRCLGALAVGTRPAQVVERPVAPPEAPPRPRRAGHRGRTALAAATAVGTSAPRARWAAMAEDSEQPVPWVLGVSTCGPVEHGDLGRRRRARRRPGRGPAAGPGDSTPGRWPPLTSTQVGPRPWMRRASSAMASTSCDSGGSHAGQEGGLPQVGRDHQGSGQQVAPVGVDAPVVEEDPAGGGHHHRVHHQSGQIARTPASRPTGSTTRRSPACPVLTGGHREVVEHGVDLGVDHRRRARVDLADRGGVLGGDGGDGGGGEDARARPWS